MSVVRTPEERFRELPDYPFAPRYLAVDGMRIHYVDEGQGAPVLLLHGEPTWSFLYRRIIPQVVEAGARAVAPDYVGFGKSDKWTDEARYSYTGHVAILTRVVEALDLRAMTIVVQDWGGPIGLRLAVQQPERVARLVVLNTGLFTGHEPLSEGLQAWRAYAARTPDLPAGLVVRRAAVDRGRITDEIVRAYDAPFPDLASKAGARAFPAMIPTRPGDPGGREMVETQTALARRAPPTLVLWSDQDRVFPIEAGRRFAGLFPGATFRVVEGAGHFLQEERGAEIGREVARFIAG
ncbi:MAG TPA: haloalkane dehalogenase [Methylomirabilota bacterium]|jgi:haloalkane dehalogenase|nr:haloalkane dehalogenase [Methylomirabilota bacterium]